MSKRAPRLAWAFYAASILVHAFFAVGAAYVPPPKRTKQVHTIVLQEIQSARKIEKVVEAPPPPPPPPPPPRPKAEEPPPPPPESETAEADAAEAEAEPADFQDLGLAMGNAGGPGIAVPTRNAIARKEEVEKAETKAVQKKVASLGPKPTEGCDEAPVKPKPLRFTQPAYTEEARQASVEGKIKVELTIDENGKVVNVKIVKGLGYGLDEITVATLEGWEFRPGSHCGKPQRALFTLNVRFSLSG